MHQRSEKTGHRPSEQLGIDVAEEAWLAYQWDRAVYYWGSFVSALLSERTKPNQDGYTECVHDIDAVLGYKTSRSKRGTGGKRAVNTDELKHLVRQPDP